MIMLPKEIPHDERLLDHLLLPLSRKLLSLQGLYIPTEFFGLLNRRQRRSLMNICLGIILALAAIGTLGLGGYLGYKALQEKK